MQYAWLSDFNISEDQRKSWSESLPQGRSLLRWAIESGHLQPQAFRSWAVQHYKLPTLQDSYSSFSSSQEIFLRYSNLWPDTVAPIAEWDGVLFLGCLEPDFSFQPPQKHQWVVVSLEQLTQLRQETLPKVEAPKELEAPAGLSLSSLDAPTNPPDLGGIQIESSSEVPIGLSSVGDIHALDPAGISFEGLSLSVDDTNHEPKTRVVEAPQGMPSIPPATSGLPELNFMAPPSPPPVPPSMGQNYQIPPPPPISPIKPIAATLSPLTPPPLSPLQPPPLPPIAPAASQQSVPPPPPQRQASAAPAHGAVDLDSAGQSILGEMAAMFDKSMILLFQGERLEPWRWSKEWILDMNRNRIVDLSSASVFRIVNETKSPYHGHVVPNGINDSFFQTWMAGQTPEHLTLVPLLIGKNLAGMLLGVCKKVRGDSLDLKNVLSIADRAAEKLVQAGHNRAA